MRQIKLVAEIIVYNTDWKDMYRTVAMEGKYNDKSSIV